MKTFFLACKANEFIFFSILASLLIPSYVFASAQIYSAESQALIDKAPVLLILLDNSESSPAKEQSFAENAWRVIKPRLEQMPVGSLVIVRTTGDNTIMPTSVRFRVLKRRAADGGKIEDISNAVQAAILGFPKWIKEHGAHHSSHLISAISDAARDINPASSENNIIYLTDLLEYSDVANCEAIIAGGGCLLPKPDFRLEGTIVQVYGVGTGLNSSQQSILFKAWNTFFSRTGAKYSLKKTF